MGKAHYKLKCKVRCKALENYGMKGEVIQLIQQGNKYKFKVLWEDGKKEIRAKRSLCREDELKAMKGKKMTRRSQVSSSSREYSDHDDSSDEMESNSRSSSSESDDNDGKSDAEESHRYVAFCVFRPRIYSHL